MHKTKKEMDQESRINLEGFEPYSKPVGELYLETLQELVTPYPAMELEGWGKFNELVGGFRTREFTILCGATGSGKTTLLAHWAKAFLAAGKRTFIMSVETGHTDFIKRTMSAFSGIDLNKGYAISEDVLRRIHKNCGEYLTSDNMFLSLYDNRVNYKTVLAEIEWHRLNKKCEIVFIDNLNFLLDVVTSDKQILIMDTVIHELIMYAKRTDVHIVMVMHPRKTDHTRVESEFDIKGSSTAVQEAHNVFLFNRPRKTDVDSGVRNPMDRELIIRKLRRRGESIGRSLWLSYTEGSYREQSIEWTI